MSDSIAAGSAAVNNTSPSIIGGHALYERLTQNLPTELLRERRFVVWRPEERDGQITKPPRRADDPTKYADVSDPATWGTFEQAVAAVERGDAAGMGVMLGDGWIGVDLDDCRDPLTETTEAWALDIVGQLKSYTEVSPSGTGLHGLLRGKLPPGGRRKGNIEVYDGKRYFTLTGDWLPGTPTTIEERTAEIAQWHASVFANADATSDAPPSTPCTEEGEGETREQPLTADDEALIARASACAATGEEFRKLWAGERMHHPSDSERDFRLCKRLAYWTNGGAARIGRLFRASGCWREKWERHDYRTDTIAAAIAAWQHDEAARASEPEAAEPSAAAPTRFVSGVGGYELIAPSATLRVAQPRREKGELIGDLTVISDRPGVRTIDGVLSEAPFVLSSIRARGERARHLERLAKDCAWDHLIEELCVRVSRAERQGQPAVLLSDLPPVQPGDQILSVDGLHLARYHPSILFGNGGSMKSYLLAYVLGTLARRGLNVALFDWEMSASDHRERLGRLFGADMPPIHYVPCQRPLIVEADHLARICDEYAIDYFGCDSIVFGCDGKATDDDVAGRYYQGLRRMGVGSKRGAALTAHCNRSDDKAEMPFGSVFWHNQARATYYVIRNNTGITVTQKKSNFGPEQKQPLVFDVRFDASRTHIQPHQPPPRRRDEEAPTPAAEPAPISKRAAMRAAIEHALLGGPLSRADVAAKCKGGDRKSGGTFGRVWREMVSAGRLRPAPGRPGVWELCPTAPDVQTAKAA